MKVIKKNKLLSMHVIIWVWLYFTHKYHDQIFVIVVCTPMTIKFKFKCLFSKPHMEEYKKITVNVISKTYNITHINVYIIIQSITVFSLHTF